MMESKTPVIAIIGNGNPRILTCSKCIKDCHGRAIELEAELADAQKHLSAIMAVLPDGARPYEVPDLIEFFKTQMSAYASHGIELEKQLKEARAEIERLSSRDGNASHELVYDDGNNPFAREKLEHIDFGVCDNQYVLESHLLNNTLELLKGTLAEIERLKTEIRDNNHLAARQIIPAEMAVDDLRAEIERLEDEVFKWQDMLHGSF